MRRRVDTFILACAAAAAAAAGAPSAARAQSHVWVGPGESAWHDPDNWSTGTVPNDPAADALVDGAFTLRRPHVRMRAATVVRSLTVANDARVTVGLYEPHVALTADELLARDGGDLWLSGTGSITLTGAALRTRGSGMIYSIGTVALHDVTVPGRFRISQDVTTFEGLLDNQPERPGEGRIEVVSQGTLRARDPGGAIAAPAGSTGEVYLSGGTLAGVITLRNQLVHGTGTFTGAVYNGDVAAPSRIVARPTGTEAGIRFGSGHGRTHIFQTPDSVIEATGGAIVQLFGDVWVQGGRLTSTHPFSSIVADGPALLRDLRNEGTLHFTGEGTLSNVVNTGTIMLSGGATLTIDGGNVEQSTIVAWGGTPSIVTAGAEPLTMRDGGLLRVTTNGTFTPQAGTDLRAASGGRIVAAPNGTIRAAAGRDLRADAGGLIFVHDGGSVMAPTGNVVAGPGGVIGVGGGVVGAISGAVRAEGGWLAGRGGVLNAVVAGAGTLAPGDVVDPGADGPYVPRAAVGSITVSALRMEGADARVALDVRADGGTDFVNVAAEAALAGAAVVRAPGAEPVLPGQAFDVMRYQSRTGAFDAVLSETPFPGLSFVPTYGATTLTLTAAARGGDANLDAVVNLNDFNTLAAHFGQSGQTWLAGDFTHDGVVNLEDFNVLAGNFGQGATGAGAPTPADWGALASAVPEPAGGGAIVGALVALTARRVRRVRASSAARAHGVAPVAGSGTAGNGAL